MTQKRVCYHVTASANRDSILQHGLDVSKMGDQLGIAGSIEPEVEGIYLCEDEESAWWFATFPGHREPPLLVDVWEVDATGFELVEGPEGYSYYSGRIPLERV